ncbi:hypothetical protein [Deinococcus sp. UR1]|uniref:hypothetical protein n=1 Tax=Deinococcus sp. UR1 TaxID=1704277 RepID=UPI0011AF84D8|nr:hypothetical protein [Deinococcus sp. UR1]
MADDLDGRYGAGPDEPCGAFSRRDAVLPGEFLAEHHGQVNFAGGSQLAVDEGAQGAQRFLAKRDVRAKVLDGPQDALVAAGLQGVQDSSHGGVGFPQARWGLDNVDARFRAVEEVLNGRGEVVAFGHAVVCQVLSPPGSQSHVIFLVVLARGSGAARASPAALAGGVAGGRVHGWKKPAAAALPSTRSFSPSRNVAGPAATGAANRTAGAESEFRQAPARGEPRTASPFVFVLLSRGVVVDVTCDKYK